MAIGRQNGILIGIGIQPRRPEVTVEQKPEQSGKRLVDHHHKKRPLRTWVVPLLVILAIIYFLPRLVGLLDR